MHLSRHSSETLHTASGASGGGANILSLTENSESSIFWTFNSLNGLQFTKTQEPFYPRLPLEPISVSLQFILVPTNVNSAFPQAFRSIRNHTRFSPRASMARIIFIFKSVPSVPLLILRSAFQLVLQFRIPIFVRKFEYNSIPAVSFPCFWFVSLLSVSLESFPTHSCSSAIFLRTFDFDGAAARTPFELYR
jgi:hypothetical protein